MEIRKLPYDLSVCKLTDTALLDAEKDFYFIGRTADEISLVCKSGDVPETVLAREDGWKAFYIAGVLDFSLVGILSGITSILAAQKIGIFAVSTYNTDYILVKEKDFERALCALGEAGYTVC
jgi:hypothetical protein